MKKAAAKLPALPAASGALIAVLAFYGRSGFEYLVLAITLAVATFSVVYGARRFLSYFILGILCGTISCYVNMIPSVPQAMTDGGKHPARFEILRVGEGPKGMRCLGESTGVPHFRVYINVTDKSNSISEGDIIDITNAQLDDIFHTSEIPFMESEVLSARCDGVSAKIIVSGDDIRLAGHLNNLQYRLRSVRDCLAMAIYQSELPSDVSALIASVCLGSDDTPVTVKEQFRTAGIAHLLCVSGFHVGIMAFLAMLILWPLRLWSHGVRLRYLITILLVWLYVAVIGFTPSAIRAAIMLSAYYGGRLLQRGSSAYNSLALAFFILLLVQPRWLYSVGFQLSVSAVLGILLFANKLNPAAMRNHTLYRLCEVFTVPLAAMLGTAPVLLCRFHSLPLLTVLTNAFATLLFTPFITLGCIAVILSDIGIPIGILSKVLTFIYNMVVRLCEYSNDGTALSGVYLSNFTLGIIIMSLIFLALILHTKNNKLRIGSAAGLVAAVCLGGCEPSPPLSNEIIVAGNGSASELIVRYRNRGYAFAISNTMSSYSNMRDYFAGYGIDEDSIFVNVDINTLDLPEPAVATHIKRYRRLRPAGYLVVDGSYSDDIAAALSCVKPQHVILCPNLSAAKRLKWENACLKADIQVMQPCDKALQAEF